MSLDRRVEEIERNQRRMAEEIEQLQRELRSLGVHLPELDPAASGKTPRSPEARLAALRRGVAIARSRKRVGEGRGAVRNPETAERLKRSIPAPTDDETSDV